MVLKWITMDHHGSPWIAMDHFQNPSTSGNSVWDTSWRISTTKTTLCKSWTNQRGNGKVRFAVEFANKKRPCGISPHEAINTSPPYLQTFSNLGENGNPQFKVLIKNPHGALTRLHLYQIPSMHFLLAETKWYLLGDPHPTLHVQMPTTCKPLHGTIYSMYLIIYR